MTIGIIRGSGVYHFQRGPVPKTPTKLRLKSPDTFSLKLELSSVHTLRIMQCRTADEKARLTALYTKLKQANDVPSLEAAIEQLHAFK